jgi:hypothetical protein
VVLLEPAVQILVVVEAAVVDHSLLFMEQVVQAVLV